MFEQTKIALITGANRGIGFEIARQLAQTGIHILLSGRDTHSTALAASCLKSEGLSVTPYRIDVADESSITAAAQEISKIYDRLDILVNNAGIRIEEYGKKPSEQPIEAWRETFNTNMFGVVQVTKEFLPMIVKATAGRIVNVSSLLGSVTVHSNPQSYAYSDMFKSLPAYSASKSAINSWTAHLAYEFRNTPIKVNAVHPGYTKTKMNNGAGDQEITEGARTSVEMALIGPNGPNGSFMNFDKSVPW